MKKILFVSQALPPYLYPQSIQVGRFLEGLKSRYDVHILCASENTRPDPTLYPDLYDGIQSHKILKVPYVFNPYANYFKNRCLPLLSKCPDLYASWARKAYTACLSAFPSAAFEAIVTFSFPFSLNILGRRLKAHYNCPWIAHESDPWADNPFQRFGLLTGSLNRAMERACFHHADALIFTCVEAAELYRARYPELSKRIGFINHSFDPTLFPLPDSRKRDRKIIRYIGGFYGARTAEPLLEAVAALVPQAKERLRFEIVGANLKTRVLLQKYCLPPDLVTVTGRVNYAESLRLMINSDVLLVIDAPLSRDNVFFPSKLADYIGAGCPIIGVSSPGPTSRILASLNQVCYRHDQVGEIARAFERIAAGDFPAPPSLTEQRTEYLNSVTNSRFVEYIDSCLFDTARRLRDKTGQAIAQCDLNKIPS